MYCKEPNWNNLIMGFQISLLVSLPNKVGFTAHFNDFNILFSLKHESQLN